MTTLTFDTHQFVKGLVAAGISETQSEALVTQLSEVQIANVATQLDVADFKQEFAEVKQEIVGLREGLRTEISQVKVELLKWLAPLLLGQVAAFAFLMQWIVGQFKLLNSIS